MEHIPTTSIVTNTFLLDGLREENNEALWHRYVSRYRPMITRFSKRFVRSEADAEDCAQHTLAEFCIAFRNGKYDRNKGRLRQWLFGIARNQVNNFVRRRPRERQIVDQESGTGMLDRLPDEGQLESCWEQEWREAMLAQCLQQVRQEFAAKTVDAFELFGLRGVAAQDVAAQLDMSTDSIYTAKRRVLQRVRELLSEMEEHW